MLTGVRSTVTYIGDGETRVWDFPDACTFLDEDHVKVSLTDTDGEETVISVGYSVDMTARQVTYPDSEEEDALPSGWQISIYRQVPFTQEMDASSGTFSGSTLETQLDKIVMQIQQIRDNILYVQKTEWYAGDGAPSGSLGSEGDLYVNTNETTGTGDLYQKVDGAWEYQLNIQGPTGETGATGYFSGSLNEELNVNNHDVSHAKRITFNGEIDNGDSGSSKTIDLSAGAKQKLTLTADCTLTFTNPVCGHYLLKIVQDTTGGWTLTFPSGKWPSGWNYEATEDASAVDFVSLYYDGSTYWYSIVWMDMQ